MNNDVQSWSKGLILNFLYIQYINFLGVRSSFPFFLPLWGMVDVFFLSYVLLSCQVLI
jgi:hypothetical protein